MAVTPSSIADMQSSLFATMKIVGWMQWLSLVLVLSSVVLLAYCLVVGAPLAMRGKGKRVLEVDSGVKSFGVVQSGSVICVSFFLSNHGSSTIRILGSSDVCLEHGCMKVEGLPLAIAPSQGRRVWVVVSTRGPAAFRGRIKLYTDVPDMFEIFLGVEGRVVRAALERRPVLGRAGATRLSVVP